MSGTLEVVSPISYHGSNGFFKREIVVRLLTKCPVLDARSSSSSQITTDETYPQTIKFDLPKEKAETIDESWVRRVQRGGP